MSAQKTGRSCMAEGMMNQYQYKKVIEHRLISQFKDYTLKKQRLKITQLEKVRFIKVNELKLTAVE